MRLLPPGPALALTCLLACAGAQALAQSAADALAQTLSRVPQAALAGGQGTIVAGYGNGDALRWIAVRGAQIGRNPDTPNRFAALRSAPPAQQAIIAAATDADLRAAAGLQPLDWVDSFEVAQGTVRVGAMDIFPDSGMRLRGALFSRGYEQADRSGTFVLWQGLADHAADPALVDPAFPFGGDLGLPMRVAFTGDRAVWATGWAALDHLLAPAGPTLAERDDAQALIAGLRQVAGNPGALVSVRAWFGGDGPLPIRGAEAGPARALALADYAVGEREGAALVLLLPEGMDGSAFAARLAEAWPILGSGAPGAPGAPDATPEIAAGAHSVTITLTAGWGEDGAAVNGPYATLLDVLGAGRLGLLLTR